MYSSAERIIWGRTKIKRFVLSSVFSFLLKREPIRGIPPRQEGPVVAFVLTFFVMPLRMRKCPSGTWTEVAILVLEVWMPVRLFVLWII